MQEPPTLTQATHRNPKTSARVLTSIESVQIMDEKLQKKKVRLMQKKEGKKKELKNKEPN